MSLESAVHLLTKLLRFMKFFLVFLINTCLNIKIFVLLDDSSKQKTTLKDRIKSFRKTSNAAGSGGADDAEGTGMFGVPIKCCIPSPNNDVGI